METIEKGNNSCMVITKKPFLETINRFDIMKLSPQDREKVFLRWKHGSKDHETNLGVELTDKYLLSRITDEDIEKMGEYDKWFWTMERKWWDKCRQIKEEIGLESKKSRTKELLNSIKVDPETKKVSDIFGGKVTEWEE